VRGLVLLPVCAGMFRQPCGESVTHYSFYPCARGCSGYANGKVVFESLLPVCAGMFRRLIFGGKNTPPSTRVYGDVPTRWARLEVMVGTSTRVYGDVPTSSPVSQLMSPPLSPADAGMFRIVSVKKALIYALHPRVQGWSTDAR